MIQLRVLEQMGELTPWLGMWEGHRWPLIDRPTTKQAPARVIDRLNVQDSAQWLEADIPALRTKAGTSPLGRALKGLSRPWQPA